MPRHIEYFVNLPADQVLARIRSLISSSTISWWDLYIDRFDAQKPHAGPEAIAGAIVDHTVRLYGRLSRGWEVTPATIHGSVEAIDGDTRLHVNLRYPVTRIMFAVTWVGLFALIAVSPIIYYLMSLIWPGQPSSVGMVLALLADCLVVAIMLKLDRSHNTVGERALLARLEAALDGAIERKQCSA